MRLTRQLDRREVLREIRWQVLIDSALLNARLSNSIVGSVIQVLKWLENRMGLPVA